MITRPVIRRKIRTASTAAWNTIYRVAEVLFKAAGIALEVVVSAVEGVAAGVRTGVTEERQRRVRSIALSIVNSDDEFKIVANARGVDEYLWRTIDANMDRINHYTAPTRLEFKIAAAIAVVVSGFCVITALILGSSAVEWFSNVWPKLGQHYSAVVGLGLNRLSDLLGIHSIQLTIFSLVGSFSFTLLLCILVIRWAFRVYSQYVGLVEQALVPIIRVALNGYANRHRPNQLLVNSAPGLGETFVDSKLVSRAEAQRIETMFSELGVHAIAISGPRGVGKTTLLRAVADPDLIVAAPVSYNALDFIVHLYVRVCEFSKDFAAGIRSSRFQRVLSAIRQTLVLIVFGAIFFTWVSFFVSDVNDLIPRFFTPVPPSQSDARLSSIVGRVLVTAALLLIYMLLSRLHRPGFSSPAVRQMRRSAASELRRLRYMQTMTREQSGSVARWGLTFGGRRSKQLAEKPITLPELISSYRSFVVRFVSWRRTMGFGDSLTIGIDEVDRILTAQEAERFVNDVKAIFGVRGCRYVVTVSEETLAGFERRVIRLRPALDSAFDEVLRLGNFTLEQSMELLSQRVAGFSFSFVALCHCVSGGVPRDILRAARSLVEQCRSTNESDIELLADQLIANEIQTLKRGILSRLVGLDDFDQFVGVLEILADEDWPGTSIQAMLLNASTLSRTDSELANDRSLKAGIELAISVYYYATVQQIFGRPHLLAQIQMRKAEVVGLLTSLASTRGLLPLSVALAERRIADVRAELGFWPRSLASIRESVSQ